MKGDFHVRFCGNAGVKLPCVTRLAAVHSSRSSKELFIYKYKIDYEDYQK
jgi:hypothetical protein